MLDLAACLLVSDYSPKLTNYKFGQTLFKSRVTLSQKPPVSVLLHSHLILIYIIDITITDPLGLKYWPTT